MKLYDVRILRQELEACRRLEQELPLCQSLSGRALTQNLRRRCQMLTDTLWQIAKFIEEIQDPELRLIFELRYFRGLEWGQIAEELPTRMSADGARMRHHRYLAQKGRGVHCPVICP